MKEEKEKIEEIKQELIKIMDLLFIKNLEKILNKLFRSNHY